MFPLLFEQWGLSPRVRGNQPAVIHIVIVDRSIPACAGEPAGIAGARERRPVYPRVCGGTAPVAREYGPGRGLSPRVRGNPGRNNGPVGATGSIPACAGEPYDPHGPDRNCRVYPRVCGGTFRQFGSVMRVQGLSPRVRGNHPVGRRCGGRRRSIPACAGEPPETGAVWNRPWVYPRVCGGTNPLVEQVQDFGGLSPRVRGNPTNPGGVGHTWGLSPRVRGNPGQGGVAGIQEGSIPACAGEPEAAGSPSPQGRVYPRVCGGTRGDWCAHGP